MNSTRGKGLALLGWLVALCLAAHAQAADTTMPRPPELEPDVQFWIRVYTQVDTNGGFIHDADNLAIVYDTVHFDAGASPHERQKVIEREEDQISAALRRIAAAKAGTLSDADQKIRALWGAQVMPSRLRDAADNVRFQLGQADRFRAGLIR